MYFHKAQIYIYRNPLARNSTAKLGGLDALFNNAGIARPTAKVEENASR